MNTKQLQSGDARPEWLDLKELQRYACVSERTLRTWIHAAIDPLPASRVGSKILVRRREFDAYIERHAIRSTESVNGIVKEILEGMTVSD